jgi:transposase
MFIDSRDLQLLAAQGLTMREAAHELGVPYIRVRRAVMYYTDVQFRAEPGPGRPTKIISPYVDRLKTLAAEGKTRAEIMRVLGVCRKTLSNLERVAGVQIAHGSRHAAGSPVDARAEKMVLMYRQGLTLEKIGQAFDLSRERVRQILKKQGVTGEHGGQSKVSRSKRQALANELNASSLAKWGLPRDEMNKWRSAGLVYAYKNQRSAAKCRGISWGLNFAQWLDVWLTSGKLEQRGRGKGKYCMSRIKDSGGYEIGNVHIQPCEDNSREGLQKHANKNKAHPGVWHLYPGLERGWVAKYGKHVIGRYATQEEAIAARDGYLAEHGIRAGKRHGLGKGRGWTYIKKCKSRPYLVQVAGKQSAYCATQQEAEALYQQLVAERLAA